MRLINSTMSRYRPTRHFLRRCLFRLLPCLYCVPLLVLIACEPGGGTPGGGTPEPDVVAVNDGPFEIFVNDNIDIEVLNNDLPTPLELEINSITRQPRADISTATIQGRVIRFTCSRPSTETFEYAISRNGIVSNKLGTVTVVVKPRSSPDSVEAFDDPSPPETEYVVPRRRQVSLPVLTNDDGKGRNISIARVTPEPLDNGQRSFAISNDRLTILYNAYGGTGIVHDEFQYYLGTFTATGINATVRVKVVPSSTATCINNSDSDVTFNFGINEDLSVPALGRNVLAFFPINASGDTAVGVVYKGQRYEASSAMADGSQINVRFENTPSPSVFIEQGGRD